MNFKELLNSKTPPKKDDLTDDDLARLFIKYKGLLKKLERDEAFWLATNENIKRAYSKLDELVEERTIELKIVNDQLQRELIERKKAETDLRKIANQWQTTFDAMSESVFLLDIEKKFLQCNKATLDVLGKEKYDEIIGYSCYEIIHGINEPVEWCPMVRMIESGHKESSIAQIGDRWCDISVDPVINDEGTLIGAVHIITDITERKKSEQKLRESEEKYKLLSTVTTDYVYEWDLKTDILEWFGSFDEALGYKKGEIPRTIEAWVSKIHPEDQKKLRDSIEHHRKSINIINEEYRMHHKDGKWLYWIDQGAPIVRDGLPIKWIGGCKDVTKRKDAEQKLLISETRFREAYNRAEFYKDLFAHDINNILQSILSANEIIASLGNYETNQKIVRLIEIIKEQVNRGKKLVSNVRKLSQIEGQEIIIEKIEIFNILKKAVKFIHNSFHDKNLKIQIKTFSEQIYIKANELIEEVFENILINAVKYNNNPTIEINIKISKLAKEGNNYYKIEFIDNGVGIEDDRKTTIFQRADKSIRGMGLGLSLVKKIIQKYEGKVWVENIVKDDCSKGSNFIILIPEVIKDD